ncbi:uncharacterized protein LOC123661546 [Melitaea cinxia]|uniref:uncharacterized protein LOC123661546 n=1 Tax=Melitaea cinxia TaxID=113334 RepID=UPI001E27370D|nr:uncharacterized protein LOC123661546 [Melitaea cinxia]
MCTEPLKLIPRERWDELKLVAQSDWPRSISILTLLETEEYILKQGIDYGFKVFCPNGIMTNGIVAMNVKNSLYEVIILCPKDDISELEKALRKTALIEWTKLKEIPFAPKNVADCVRRITNDKKLLYNHCTKTQTYLLDKDSNLFDVSLAPDLKFELLSLDHVNITNSKWPHKFPGSEWYYELLIKSKLGYGLFKNGELVAWSFIKEMGALGHLYTLENHRRKGYGELVLKLISNALLKEKKYVYAFCVAGNTAASNLYEKLGFANVFDVEWLSYMPS